MLDKRKAELSSARLSSNGYLRLSSDLVPADARKKKIKFVVTPLPEQKKLVLKIVSNGDSAHLATRKAMWANDAAHCPLVAIRSAMRFLGVKLPKGSTVYRVKQNKDGELVIKF
jgi:hypothetical protein